MSKVPSHSLADFHIANLSLHSIRFSQLGLAASPFFISQIVEKQLVLGALVLKDLTTLPQDTFYYFLRPLHQWCIRKGRIMLLVLLPRISIRETLGFCYSCHFILFFYFLTFHNYCLFLFWFLLKLRLISISPFCLHGSRQPFSITRRRF